MAQTLFSILLHLQEVVAVLLLMAPMEDLVAVAGTKAAQRPT